MKLLISLITAFASVNFAAAHSRVAAPDIRKPSEQPIAWVGKVKRARITYNEPSSTKQVGTTEIVNEYDENGDLSLSTKYVDGVQKGATQWTYAGPGQWTEKKVFDADKQLIRSNIVKYNADGYVIEDVTLDGKGNVTQTIAYTYERLSDNSLLRISSVTGNSTYSTPPARWYFHQGYNSDGTVSYSESGYTKNFSTKTIYTYNDKKQVVKKVTQREKEAACETIYSYDQLGNVIKEESSGDVCAGTASTIYSYIYDEAGNITAAIANGKKIGGERKFEYY